MSYKDSYALTQRVSAFLVSGEYQLPDAKPLSFRDKTFQAELLDAKEAVFQAVFPQPSKEEEQFGGWIVSEVVDGHVKLLSYLKASVPRLESSVQKTSTDMFPPDGPIYAVGVGRDSNDDEDDDEDGEGQQNQLHRWNDLQDCFDDLMQVLYPGRQTFLESHRGIGSAIADSSVARNPWSTSTLKKIEEADVLLILGKLGFVGDLVRFQDVLLGMKPHARVIVSWGIGETLPSSRLQLLQGIDYLIHGPSAGVPSMPNGAVNRYLFSLIRAHSCRLASQSASAINPELQRYANMSRNSFILSAARGLPAFSFQDTEDVTCTHCKEPVACESSWTLTSHMFSNHTPPVKHPSKSRLLVAMEHAHLLLRTLKHSWAKEESELPMLLRDFKGGCFARRPPRSNVPSSSNKASDHAIKERGSAQDAAAKGQVSSSSASKPKPKARYEPAGAKVNRGSNDTIERCLPNLQTGCVLALSSCDSKDLELRSSCSEQARHFHTFHSSPPKKQQAGCPWFPESCERNPWEETQDQVASHLEMHKASLQIKSEGVPLEVAREKRRKRMSMGDEEKENKVRKH